MGDKVGPYEIRGFLGQGGMGQVYRAFDPRLERTVALKVIIAPIAGPPGSNDSAESRKSDFSSRLLREARAVAALSHPNVVAVYDVGEHEATLFFAMEYVVGTTLRSIESKELPHARKIRWLIDVARALEAAHRVGLIHRDVKPENVMVRDDGVVKVLDFGIARRTNPGGDPAAIDTVTGTGSIAGTPLYMSPEQIKGGKVDARCDQFAWGVMAYELLAGERPWPDTGDVLSVVARVLTEPAPSLREKVPTLPADVGETVHRALSKEASLRFASMADVADALEPFATHNTGDRHAVRVTPSQPSQDAAAYAATTRVPTSVSLEPGAQPPAVTSVPPPEKRISRFGRLAIPLVLLGVLGGIAAVVIQNRQKPAIPAGVRPLSTVPEAERTYKEAMSLWHDGSTARARDGFQKAIELDPTFAAAYLEYALQIHLSDTAAAQAAFQHAFEFRHLLTERDNALLEASEPLVRAKPDFEEWLARLSGKVFQFSRDYELQYYLGRAFDQSGDDLGARGAFANATRLDAKFVPALAGLAGAERNLGHTNEAVKATDSCLAASPIASVCHQERFSLFFDSGECHKAREEAEQWRSLEPKSISAATAVARALHADGAPLPAVEAALTRSWELAAPEDRPRGEAKDRMLLAMYEGDYVRAEELARKWDSVLPATSDRDDHVTAVSPRLNLLMEMNREDDAAKVAEDFLGKMEAWTIYPYNADSSITFYEPLVRTGKVTRAQFDKERTAWLEQERQRTKRMDRQGPGAEWVAWSLGWATLVESHEEAREAANHMPAAAFPMGARRTVGLEYNYGKVLALTGKEEEALVPLGHVANGCAALGQAMVVTRANLQLGRIYEARGDVAKAKAAYERVIATKASPSRTVKSAQARLAVLVK